MTQWGKRKDNQAYPKQGRGISGKTFASVNEQDKHRYVSYGMMKSKWDDASHEQRLHFIDEARFRGNKYGSLYPIADLKWDEMPDPTLRKMKVMMIKKFGH